MSFALSLAIWSTEKVHCIPACTQSGPTIFGTFVTGVAVNVLKTSNDNEVPQLKVPLTILYPTLTLPLLLAQEGLFKGNDVEVFSDGRNVLLYEIIVAVVPFAGCTGLP